MKTTEERKYPESAEAEKGVLCAIMQESALLRKVEQHITVDDFYHIEHRNIYTAMCEYLPEHEYSAPHGLMFAYIQDKMDERDYGGAINWANISDFDYSAGVFLDKYIAEIKKHSAQRAVIHAGQELIDMANSGMEPEEAAGRIAELMKGATDKSAVKQAPQEELYDTICGIIDRAEELRANPGKMLGIPTGYPDIDRHGLGFQSPDLIILAARPGMGKTSLALCFVLNLIAEGYPVVFFSLEMGKKQLLQRALSCLSGVSLDKLRRGRYSAEELELLYRHGNALANMPIHIDDTPAISSSYLYHRCAEYKEKHDVGLVVVDYLQLMKGRKAKYGSREQEVGEISRGLKAAAKETAVPILALSQLNRGVEHRQKKKPGLSDLRESGAIEQDADIVWFIHREGYYDDSGKGGGGGPAELIWAKHRNGSTGETKLLWKPEQTKFVSFAGNYDDYDV